MLAIRFAAAVGVLTAACSAYAAPPTTRTLHVINRAHDSVIGLSIALPGERRFQPLELNAPLRGGGDSTTLAIDASACRRDVRIDFRTGRSMIYRDMDLCRQQNLRIGRPPAREDDGIHIAAE